MVVLLSSEMVQKWKQIYSTKYTSSVQSVHARDRVEGHVAGGVAAVCRVAAGGIPVLSSKGPPGASANK